MSHPGLVYPSLPLWSARAIYEKLRSDGRGPAELRATSALEDPAATWYPTGARAGPEELRELRDLVRSTADELGFPETTRNSNRLFDQQLAAPLHRQMRISPARAGDGGVWAFLSLVVLPDIAVWRYQDRHHERLMGGHRNVLQRLWLRAEILGADDDGPASRLGEDQNVAILERPDALGRNPRVARALALSVLRYMETSSVSPQNLMRESAKRVMRLTAWMLIAELDEETLGEIMDEAVTAAGAALEKET